jgi:hypothetical protein
LSTLSRKYSSILCLLLLACRLGCIP